MEITKTYDATAEFSAMAGCVAMTLTYFMSGSAPGKVQVGSAQLYAASCGRQTKHTE